MTKTIPILIAAGIAIGCGRSPSPDAQGIQKAFGAYKTAILNTDGPTAVAHVSKRTIDEYQQYVDWCRLADRQTLEALSTINKLQVLLVKHRIPKADLMKMGGEAIFIHAVNNDWIGKAGVVATTIGDIQTSNGRGTAAVYINQEKAPTRFHFIEEEGSWKFDLIQTLRDADQILKMQMRQLGLEEDEFIFRMIESVSGRKVPASIWEPLEKKD